VAMQMQMVVQVQVHDLLLLVLRLLRRRVCWRRRRLLRARLGGRCWGGARGQCRL
jgi:hypothetical protein